MRLRENVIVEGNFFKWNGKRNNGKAKDKVDLDVTQVTERGRENYNKNKGRRRKEGRERAKNETGRDE